MPQYNISQANRITDRARIMAEEQADAVREGADQTAGSIVNLVNAPLNAYRTQADRNTAAEEREQKKAELQQTMNLRERQGALTEEQITGIKTENNFNAEFGGREREARIGQNESARDLASQQVKAAQAETEFYDTPATQAGFDGAKPGQTTRQYELAQGVAQKSGALDVQKSQIKLAESQMQANKELAGLNKANLAVEIAAKKLGLNEAERSARVRDFTSRFSSAGDDPAALQAIAKELTTLANPSEVSEALSATRNNIAQRNILANEIARRDPNYGYLVGKMQEGSESAQQVSTINASLDDALDRYTGAKTAWSDEADDALKNIQSQLRGAGFEAQAADLDSVLSTSVFELGSTRKERATKSIKALQKSLGTEYQAKYGHFGAQYANFGKSLIQKGFSGAQSKTQNNQFLPQGQAMSATVPLPTQLGPNFYQQIPGAGGQPQIQQANQPMQQQPMQQPMQQQQQQFQPMPQQQHQTPVTQPGGYEPPPMFKPKMQVGGR